jgi:ATP-dependent exoDNAse (exonuclease V) beta subunit
MMTSKPAVDMRVSDAAVREEVLDTTRSFIVQAPAGSGKTELLMQRYLALLATVDEPESVLAITFTIKAASEMRNRIVAALRGAQCGEPVTKAHQQRTRDLALAVLSRTSERNWKLLENPARMQIRTVDSFCESVARRTPLLAGIGGGLGITETVAPLYEEAARRTLELLGSEDDAIARTMMTLLEHVDNDIMQVQRLFNSMLEKRERWLRLVARTESGGDLCDLRVTLEASLKAAIRDELQTVRGRWNADIPRRDEETLLKLARFAATTPTVEDKYKQFATWNKMPGSDISDLEGWCAWSQWLMSGKDWRRSGTEKIGFPPAKYGSEYRQPKQDYGVAMEAFREERREALAHAMYRVTKLPSPVYTDKQWELVCALFRILPHAVENLKAVFVDRSVMDFAQLSQAAIEALREGNTPRDLRHVLVDEFQDTSTTQVELLSRMTADWQAGDGRSLFLVGDPMQSIYAFREAEVVLFERTRTNGVKGLPLASRKLEVNFRSQQSLVEWFNEVFPELMTEANDLRGAVKYEPCTAIQPTVEEEPVQLHAFFSDDPRPEAERIVSVVRESLETTTGDIAILVRARTHLPAIVEGLRHAGISYRGVDLDPLNTRQAVLDVDALAQALEHVGNRTAWLALLRAPWCGLSLADLWELCRDDKYTPVIDLLQQRATTLSTQGQQRVARILPVMHEAVAQYGRSALRPLLERTWVSIGGPAAVRSGLDGEADRQDIEAYFDLVSRYEVAGALPERRTFARRVEELYAAPDTSDGIRVQIMTIFMAKGLEFETVIVPGLGRKTGGDGQSLLYWRERILGGETHLLLAPMEAVKPDSRDEPATLEGYLQRLERDRDREEGKRLLYVAATRAKRKLHLLGHVGTTGNAEGGSLLYLLMSAKSIQRVFECQKPPEETEQLVEIAAAEESSRQSPVLRRLAVDWRLPAAPEPLRWKHALRRSEREEPPHTYEWVSDTLRRIGTVTHAFLQQIARDGLEAWSVERIAKSAALIRLTLNTEGVALDEMPDAVQKVVRALQAAVTEERGRWVLKRRTEAASEFEISGVLDGQLFRVKLDRTFVDEEGTRWIVDYKTADRTGSSLETFLDEQENKYRPDLERYARMVRALEGRPVRAGLYLPLLASWREVTLDGPST